MSENPCGNDHVSVEAKARCWGCSHPELLAVTEDNLSLARQLIADGYVSTSNKYHTVQRSQRPTLMEIVDIRPDAPSWMVQRLYDLWGRHVIQSRREWLVPDTERTLTPAEFRAFKKAGGQVA